MSSEWTVCTLGDFVRLQRGHDLTAQEQRPGAVPVMGSAGPNGSHDRALATGPGVVVGRSGASAGRVHFSEADYWPHNTCLYVTDFCGNSPKFAYYLLQTLPLATFNSGSAQASLNRNFLYSIPLNVPSRQEQDKIVETLQLLDDRITLLHETNATLEAIAQALFKSWFVDFDPVLAKMEGRVPEGMDEATAALFPYSFEETELGDVPRGWYVAPFSSVCSISSGKRPLDRSDQYDMTTSVALYGGAGVMGFTSQALFDSVKILTGRVGTLGKVFIANPPFWASDNVLVINPLHADIFSFTYHWLCSIDIANLNRGSTQPLLTQKDLGAQIGVVAPSAILSAFDDVVKLLYAKIHESSEQAKALESLRDVLLPRLISGNFDLSCIDVRTEISA